MTALAIRLRVGFGDVRNVGHGYIRGTVPHGMLTVDSTPARRWIEARARDSRRVIRYVFSAADGSYFLPDLDPAIEVDLIARDYTDTYNDAIVSRVRPEPYDLTTLTDALVVDNITHSLTGGVAVTGGLPGHTVEVTAGTAPTGITFAMGWLQNDAGVWGFAAVPSGTTTAGTYTWTLTVTAPNGTAKSIELIKMFA